MLKTTIPRILVPALIAGLAGCSDPSPNPGELPVIDGSTSTHPLGRLVACSVLGLDYRWVTPQGMERTIVAAEHTPRSRAKTIRDLDHSGTHGAYVSLIDRKADLILVARAPSANELKTADRAGVRLDARPVARDALVFVTNTDNPVTGLTLDQIRRIFGHGDNISNWSEVEGPHQGLRPFQRQANSGSQELIQRLVMGNHPMVSAETAPLIYTMGGVVNTMAVQHWGISFSVFYYIVNMKPNPKAKMITVEGVHPTSESIFDGSYPLISDVFVVVRHDSAPDSPEADLRNWLLTEPGQSVIREAGYVPLR